MAPPTPVNGCSEGGSRGRGCGASSGKGRTGPGGQSWPRSLGEVPLGKAWVADLRVAPLARPPRETKSGGSSPKSPGERRDGPGLRGAEPAPFLGLRCAQPRTETDLPRHNPEERPGSPTAHFLPHPACGARPLCPAPPRVGLGILGRCLSPLLPPGGRSVCHFSEACGPPPWFPRGKRGSSGKLILNPRVPKRGDHCILSTFSLA